MKRIYNKSNLVKGNTYHLEEKYYIHLIKVMRLNIGEQISLFNEENGEWIAKIIDIKKNSLTAEVLEQSLPPIIMTDISLLFSPIKHLNSESIIRQSTEIGIKSLYPTKFHRTVVSKINLTKFEAYGVGAAHNLADLSSNYLPNGKLSNQNTLASSNVYV